MPFVQIPFADEIAGEFSPLGNSYFIAVNYSETPREQRDKLFKRPQI